MRRWLEPIGPYPGRCKPRPPTCQGCQPELRLSQPASAGTAQVRRFPLLSLSSPPWSTADQPGVGERTVGSLQLRPDDSTKGAVGRLPRDTIESSTRTVVPWPDRLWSVIVPLDAPGLVGRRDDPRPESANSAWASPSEPAIVSNARSGVRISRLGRSHRPGHTSANIGRRGDYSADHTLATRSAQI